jgi:hypothetical protein
MTSTLAQYPHPLTELYQNQIGGTYQCDLTNRIFVTFNGVLTAFRAQDFLLFKRRVDGVDIHEMIFNLDDAYDVEVIESPRREHTFVLTLCELIHLRDLLAGTKFALDLNTLLHERLYSVPVY